MRTQHLAVAALAALIICFASTQAAAGTTTDSDTTGLILTDFSETLSVDQFDSSLGTLTQVTLTVSGQLQGAGKYENSNSYAVNDTMRYLLDQALDVTWLSGTLLGVDQNLDNTIPVVADPFDGVVDYAGPSGYTEPANTQSDSQIYVFTLPGDLAAFIGSGTVDFSAIADATATIYPPNGVISATYSLGEATIEVEYLYTPIPEPGLLALAAGGAIALRLRRRRR
jgi:hypothetical protein